jgi:hypothetical protein
MKKVVLSGLVVGLFLCASLANAALLTGELTGDFRLENPDNLIVDVGITLDGSTASWVIDIDSPLHPDIKLGAFYFNLDLDPNDVVNFGNISPNNPGKQWVVSDGINAVGSGGADFDFGIAQIGAGNPRPNEVNNMTNLTFDMILEEGVFTEAMFTGAGLSTGGGIPDPGAQMGAHLQSLVAEGPEGSDSGFASGNYDSLPPVPIPPAVFLLGSGLIAFVGFRKKFKK